MAVWQRSVDKTTAGLVVLSCLLHLAGLVAVTFDGRTDPVYKDVKESYGPISRAFVEEGSYSLNGSEIDATNVQPVFPALLIVARACIGHLPPAWAFGLLNIALRIGAAFFVRELASLAFGERTARWALALVLLDPWSFYWGAFFAKESVAVCAFLWSLFAIGRADVTRTRADAFGAGLVVGVAFLSRFPSALVLVPGLLALLRVSPARPAGNIKLAAWMLAGFAVTSATWVARSIVLTRWPLPSAFSQLYAANAPGLEDSLAMSGFPDSQKLNWFPAWRRAPPGTPRARAELGYVRAVVGSTVRHPLSALKLASKKAWNMWRPTFQEASRRNALLLGVPYVVQMLFAGAGLWLCRRNLGTAQFVRRTLLTYALLSLVALSELRFRQYLMPLLLVFAAHAGCRAYASVRSTPAIPGKAAD